MQIIHIHRYIMFLITSMSLNSFLMQEIRSVSYRVDPMVKRGQPSPLNPDHGYFIMIDCGRKNKYGDSVELKSKIQEAMLQPESGE